MTSGVFVREAGGGRNLATGVLTSGPPPPTPSDGFVVGQTQPTLLNTGLTDPSLLVRHDGDLFTTAAGQQIINMDVYGRIVVRHPDVRVYNTAVRGTETASACVVATDANVARLLVERCLIAPQVPSRVTDGIRGFGFTALRCQIQDTIDHFRVLGQGARVYGNFLHRPVYWTPYPLQSDGQPHNDLVQVEAGTDVQIVGNWMDARYTSPYGTHNPGPVGTTPSGAANPASTCVLLSANVGPIRTLTVTDNWMRGGYLPMTVGSSSVAGVDIGVWQRNNFAGYGISGSPLFKRADQTADFGIGTPNANTYADGTPITTVRNA